MIYQIEETENKGEFIVNQMIKVIFMANSNKYLKPDVKYENNILTKKEALALADEFLYVLNHL